MVDSKEEMKIMKGCADFSGRGDRFLLFSLELHWSARSRQYPHNAIKLIRMFRLLFDEFLFVLNGHHVDLLRNHLTSRKGIFS